MAYRKPSSEVWGGSGMLMVVPTALGPPNSLRKPDAGIEGAAVLVDGDEQGVRIVPVNVLGAVAVVAVGIHDGHPVDAVGLAQIFDHDGFDVDVAKAAGAVDHPHGVVARRADQGKAALDLAFP